MATLLGSSGSNGKDIGKRNDEDESGSSTGSGNESDNQLPTLAKPKCKYFDAKGIICGLIRQVDTSGYCIGHRNGTVHNCKSTKMDGCKKLIYNSSGYCREHQNDQETFMFLARLVIHLNYVQIGHLVTGPIWGINATFNLYKSNNF